MQWRIYLASREDAPVEQRRYLVAGEVRKKEIRGVRWGEVHEAKFQLCKEHSLWLRGYVRDTLPRRFQRFVWIEEV